MNAPRPLYLALDQGGGSSRALIIDAGGAIRARARRTVATDHPAPGFVEQDPDALVDSLRQTAQDAIGQLTPKQRRLLKSWGLVCQRSSLLCWHRQRRRPLTPVISWQDTRTAGTFAPSPAEIHALRERTGLFPSAHHGASKFRWCLEQLREVRQAADEGSLVITPLAGYLASALTGFSQPAAVDPVSAQRTLLWNRHSGDWDDRLLADFGLSRGWLPELAASDHGWGNLVLEELSLPGRFLGGDQSAALFAGGGLVRHEAMVNLGTGAFVTHPSLPGEAIPPRLLHSLACTIGGKQHWLVEGTVNGGGSALDWLEQHAGVRYTPPRGAHWLTAVERPGLFINGVAGLGSPFWRSDLGSRFLGCRDDDQRGASVLESILFLVNLNLEQMRQCAPLTGLRLGGGLSRLPGLAQRLADLSQLPVTVTDEQETTALGLAWLLADQPGAWHRPATDLVQPTAAPRLRTRYQRWQRALDYCLR